MSFRLAYAMRRELTRASLIRGRFGASDQKHPSYTMADVRNGSAKVHIKNTCLSLNAITCRACEERCGDSAIRFKLMTGGRAAPLIDVDKCTGCGECAIVCPNNSVGFSSRKSEEVLA